MQTLQESEVMKKQAHSPDPVFGQKWTIDKEGSTFTSFRPKTETRLYEEVDGGYRLTVVGENDGQPYRWGYTATVDGEPNPVEGRPDVDVIEKRQVTNLITIGSFKKNGKIVASYERRTSPDGQTLIVIASGRLPNGATYFDVLKYKRATV